MSAKKRRQPRHPAEITADRLGDHLERWFDTTDGELQEAIGKIRVTGSTGSRWRVQAMTPRRRAVSRVSRRMARTAAVPPRRQPGAPVPRRATPAEALTRTPAEAAIAVAAKRAARAAVIPAELAKKLQDGKLEQACADCGRWESAGWYCSGCDRRMGPDDWYPNGNAERRAVAQDRAGEIAATRVKRPRGRPRAELDSTAPAVAVSTYSPDAGFWPA